MKLHLHRFQNQQWVASANACTWLDRQFPHAAGDIGSDDGTVQRFPHDNLIAADARAFGLGLRGPTRDFLIERLFLVCPESLKLGPDFFQESVVFPEIKPDISIGDLQSKN